MTTKKTFEKLSRFGTGLAGLAVLLVIVGAAVLIISNLRLRADLTAGKLYTLSDGSKKILGQLPDDVTLKFYFSANAEGMPMSLKTYADEVKDLLREYEIAGKGHITLEAYDPEPDSDAEEWAQRYGLEPQTVNPFGGTAVYCGLVAVCDGREQAIAKFNPASETTLEYDITRLVTRVAWPEKPVVGVMSSLPVLGSPRNPMMMGREQAPDRGWIAFQNLRKDFTLRAVAPDVPEIDPSVKVLIVVHPTDLPEKTLFAIDQFVLRGGRLVACVDPFCVTELMANRQNPMMMNGAGGASTLGKLFDAWGVTFDPAKLAADLGCATALNTGNGQAEQNPLFLSLGAANLSKTDLLTARLSQVMLPFAGTLSFRPSKELTFTPVFETSADNACLVDASMARFGMTAVRDELKPDGAKRVLAARLQGTFKTAFPAGCPGMTNATTKALAEGKGAVMIFADADFLNDQFCVRAENTIFGTMLSPLNDNLALFENTIEQFAGREELIGVRSRGRFNRPFVKVDALEAKALHQWQAEAQRLEAKLRETQERLATLQQQKKGDERMILSKEQQAELEQFRQEQVKTRRQLKDVRKNLNGEIEGLGRTLKTVNIVLVPVLVIVFGIVHGLRRRKH